MSPSNVLGTAGLVFLIVGVATLLHGLRKVPMAWPGDPEWPHRASVSMGLVVAGVALIGSAIEVGLATGAWK